MLAPDDARGFVAVAAQVLPFLFIASAIEARSLNSASNPDKGLGVALLLPFTGIVCLGGEVIAILALAGQPGRFAVAVTGGAMLLASALLIATLVTQFERQGLVAWRAAPKAHRWRVGGALAVLTLALVLVSFQIGF